MQSVHHAGRRNCPGKKIYRLPSEKDRMYRTLGRIRDSRGNMDLRRHGKWAYETSEYRIKQKDRRAVAEYAGKIMQM